MPSKLPLNLMLLVAIMLLMVLRLFSLLLLLSVAIVIAFLSVQSCLNKCEQFLLQGDTVCVSVCMYGAGLLWQVHYHHLF